MDEVSNSPNYAAAVEAEIAQLPRRRMSELRSRWRELYRTNPPAAFGPDLFRRSIAHKLQERVYGGLSEATRREINRIIKTLPKNPKARAELPRRIKSGSVLVREWKGKSHRVTVSGNSFTYEGKDYSNLSELARKITGTRWNGPRFFGLRTIPEGPADKSTSNGSFGAGVR